MPLTYPPCRTTDDVDMSAGVTFPDPYRWLEAETDEVRRWQRTQAELASRQVSNWPHFEALKRSVEQLNAPRFASLPRVANGRWFRLFFPPGATQAQAVVADGPMGSGRVVFDPKWENEDAPGFLSWLSPSPDGRLLALGVCSDGSENNVMRVIDVDNGALLKAPPQTLMDNWLGGAQWLPDSSGFFFTGLEGEPGDFRQQQYLYRVSDPDAVRPVEVPRPEVGHDYHGVTVSRCGRWAVAHQRILNPIPVAVLDLSKAEPGWRPFVTKIDGVLAGWVVGDRYLAVTDVDAPRGRVIAIPLDTPTPDDPKTWTELVPESDFVIRGMNVVGDRLYVRGFTETFARIIICDFDGNIQGDVPLPGKGAVAETPFPLMDLFRADRCEQFLFAFSTLAHSWGVYAYQAGASECETLCPPDVSIEGAVVEDHWAISADGARIPYHLVRRGDLSVDRPQPALLSCYGGFNMPWVPMYPGPKAAFVAAGGLFVHCHLRGGGEFGLDWWRAGSRQNKQNCYDDLYAIAEDLIARGVTTRGLLGLTGGSNGGTTCGVAMMQRPELWRVVVPRVPAMDLIGELRDPYGDYTVRLEFGNPDDPEEVRRISSFSPYHLIPDRVDAPAVFIDAGDTDPRCPPWEARKFIARLQAAQAVDRPVLLRIWENVGHGWATARDIEILENTEWLAFVMQQLGMTPAA